MVDDRRKRVPIKLLGKNGYGPNVFTDDELEEVQHQLVALETSVTTMRNSAGAGLLS